MKVLYKLTLIGLLILLGYFALTESGLIDHFNNVVNEKDGWTRTSKGNYRKEVEVRYHLVDAAILHDPNGNEIKIYRGHVKKSATDRMNLIGIVQVKFEDRDGGVTADNSINMLLKKEAKKNGANIVIVQSSGIYYENEVQTYNF